MKLNYPRFRSINSNNRSVGLFYPASGTCNDLESGGSTPATVTSTATPISTTCTTTGSGTVKNVSSSSGMVVGQLLYFATANAYGRVSVVNSSTQITLEATMTTTSGEAVTNAPGVTAKVTHFLAYSGRRVKLVFCNYYGAETFIGNAVTLGCSIELPNGTIVPVTFNGASTYAFSGSVVEIVESDEIDLGMIVSQFWTRCYQYVSSSSHKVMGGIKIISLDTSENYTALAEWIANGDYTTTAYGTPPISSITTGSLAYSPSVVLVQSSQPQKSIGLAGDSRNHGSDSTGYRTNCGGFGWRIATGQTTQLAYDTSITPRYGVVKVTKSGSTVASHESTVTFNIRFRLACYASTIIWMCDVNGGQTVSALQTSYINVIKRFTDVNKKVICVPGTPRRVSTDGFMTVGNQSPVTSTTPSDATYPTWALWDAAVLAWQIDTGASGMRQQAIANGSPAALVKVWNLRREVSCDSGGTQQEDGAYWKKEYNNGVASITGSINTTQGLALTTFRDSVNLGSISQNVLMGKVVLFTSGTYANQSAAIVSNYPSQNRITHRGVANTPSNGDGYKVVETFTADGIHPLSRGHLAMAQSALVDYSEII